MVEHWLPKPRVAGSIPVSRSSIHKYKAAAQTSMLTLRLFDFVTRKQGEYGTNGNNGTDGKFQASFPSVPLFPFVPYSPCFSNSKSLA
jgi:hypothetical protein